MHHALFCDAASTLRGTTASSSLCGVCCLALHFVHQSEMSQQNALLASWDTLMYSSTLRAMADAYMCRGGPGAPESVEASFKWIPATRAAV